MNEISQINFINLAVLNPEEPHQRNRNAEELAELERLGTALRQMSEEDGNDVNIFCHLKNILIIN